MATFTTIVIVLWVCLPLMKRKMTDERKINREIKKGPLMIEIRPSF